MPLSQSRDSAGGRRSPARSAAPPAKIRTVTMCLPRSRAKASTVAAVRGVAGVSTALSAIFIDARGDRVIVTYRDERLEAMVPDDPAGLVASVDAVLADNRFPDFVRPICLAARDRGLPVVLDADRPTQMSDDLFRIATHVVFSSECLRATTGLDDLAAALARIADLTSSFLAVTQGAQDVLWREGVTLRRSPVFAVNAVDTLGAGDVFHGAFALALAEGKDRNRGHALRRGCGGTQMCAPRRQRGGAAPRRGRSLARGALTSDRLEPIEPGRIVDQDLLADRRIRHPLRQLVEQQAIIDWER